MRTLTTTGLAASAVLLLALTGCSAASQATAEADTTTEAASLSIDDAWVKAADSGMSAAFGTLENDSDQDVTIVKAESDASPMMELHETVANDAGEMVMQEKKGGFVIPAGGSYELSPGANHLMMMGLDAPVAAGDEVGFTLTLTDGSTYEFTAPAKDYSGANETYEGDDMSDMDMSGTDADQ